MKTSLLLFAIIASAAFAQPVVPPPGQQRVRQIVSSHQNQSHEVAAPFDANYLVTLSATENDKPLSEMVIATARPEFKADSFEPTLSFSGTLVPLEDGTVLVSYHLTAEIAVTVAIHQAATPSNENSAAKNTAIQYKSQTAQAQVRLRLGEPLNVLRTGARTYRLTVSKLPQNEVKEH